MKKGNMVFEDRLERGGAGGGCWYIYGTSCNPVRLIAVQGYLLIACFAPMHFVVYV